MLKIKSKAILAIAGLMVAAFVFVGAVKTVSADMITLPTSGVSTASSMENVKNLQSFLNWNLGTQITPLVVDGKYGAKTTAAIKLFQSNNGLVADGKFGPLSSAKATALQANGTPATGSLCPNGNTLASNCMTAPSGTPTVALCPNGMTIASNCMTAPTGSTVNTGTNGYLADIAADSTNRVSTVYESEQDKVVAGFHATARLASQKVDRVRVTFLNTNTTASANLGKYISGATLWMGSTKLATMSVAQADRATATDTYTFNFSGLNANIPQDQIGRFFVSVSANGSLDTTDTTNANWTVKFVSGGVSASSPDGSYDTYPSGDITQTGLLFGKFSANGVKSELNLSTTNPASTVVAVSSTAATNNVEVLKFKIKATNSKLTLRKIPVQVTISSGTAADDVTNVINSIKLMSGTNVVDSKSGTEGYEFTAGAASNFSGTACTDTALAVDDLCSFSFSNLTAPYNAIAAGATAEFSVVIDFKSQANYATGTTVTTAFVNPDVLLAANYSVQDTNGDQLTNASSSIRIGSAIGNVMTLRVNGINVVQGTAVISKITDNAGIITSMTYDIPLAVSAFGQTLYVGQAAELAAAASGATTAAKAFSFALQEAAAPTTDLVAAPTATAVTSTLSSSDAVIETNGYRLDSGSTQHFTLQVIVSCTAAACAGATTGNYRVHVVTVRSATDGALTSPTNQTLLPNQSYQTGYQKIK
jgi:peptidoglycan hydrolase-like protein with peptidoglycan-binding domain